MKKSLTYESALQELQQIVAALQSEQTKIEDLAQQSKRAAELLAFCKARLRQIEEDVASDME
jgi:exodeoxyribonuclease VII small subunit